jgi:hypothetical protein
MAIDGKTLRKSFDTANRKAAIHRVSTWACENKMVFGHIATGEKKNEITAIPILLEMLCGGFLMPSRHFLSDVISLVFF